jgi:hypothetical protein
LTDAVRYRAAPFGALRGRQGNRVLSLPSGQRRIVPDGVFSLLDQLRAFRTLSEHAENAAQRPGTSHGRAAEIRRALEDLRRQGLLMSEEEFFRAAAPESPTAGAPIATIGIPTSGRTKLIERCVESFSAHARKYGRELRFIIAGADRARAEEFASAMGQAGIDPAIARFALLGEAADLPAGMARNTGANRNVLLLECAGEAFLSVDDDTLCSFVRSPSWFDGRGLDGLIIHSLGNPLEMWFGPELPASEAAEVDLLAELGRGLGPAIKEPGRLSTAEFDHSTLEKLCSGKAISPIVQVGLAGDAATDSPAAWLMATGTTRARLTATEAGYRAALASRRILASAPCETVSASRQLMSYCIALDHRETLPPFPPLGRDQDGVFGAWERIVEPNSFTLHVPFSVVHEPAEARSFPPGELRPPRGMFLNEVLYLLCEDSEPGAAKRTAADRMRWIGSVLEEAGSLPVADFEAFLAERRIRSLSRRIGHLEGALKTFGSRPAWWVQDVQRFLRRWEEEMAEADVLRYAEPGASPPEDAARFFRNYVGWCGRLLREWLAMREAAMRLRRRNQ